MKITTEVLCFNHGCLMRTREENKEHMRFFRFRKRFDRYKESGEGTCHYCGGEAETMHHINENHEDSRKENLLPLCHKCHLDIKHICDKPNFYLKGKEVPAVIREAYSKPSRTRQEAWYSPKSTDDYLKMCTTDRIYNLTLTNSITSKRLNISEGTIRLVKLLVSWGYVDIKKKEF